jgi:hypothetical protein
MNLNEYSRKESNELNEDEYSFNDTGCRYAELYQRLGIPDLGEILSCSRDFLLIEGFNCSIKLRRTQSIMEGASYWDFHYKLEAKENEA